MDIIEEGNVIIQQGDDGEEPLVCDGRELHSPK